MIDGGSREEWDFLVSHAYADRDWAEWIAWQLEAAGYRAWLQAWDAVPGSSWVRQVHERLRLGGRLLAVVSPEYLASARGAAEWQAVWSADPAGAAGRILPVVVARVEPAELGLLAGRGCIDLAGAAGADDLQRGEEASRRLLEGVGAAGRGRAKPVDLLPVPPRRDADGILARPHLPPALATVADTLAAALARQWQAEVGRRRLHDPHPLPVRWAVTARARALSADLPGIWRLATAAAGAVGSPAAGTWVSEERRLAGGDADIAAVLARVPTGRLVILGEGGAGKTMLAVRLVLDLLASRESGGRVPLLVRAATWDPARQGLMSWVAGELKAGYFGRTARRGAVRGHRGAAAGLVESGAVIPILDGLDEIPTASRTGVIREIGRGWPVRWPLVVTCRSDDYASAVEPPGGAPLRLAGAAVVELLPLQADGLLAWLRRCVGEDPADGLDTSRWASLGRHIEGDPSAPVSRALTTPLMAALTRTVYTAPRPPGAADPDPDELADRGSLPDRHAVEARLLAGFVPAAYGHDGPGSGRWPAPEAGRWLVFLAQALRRQGWTGLEWWQLHLLAPRPLVPVVCGLATGVAAGVALGAVHAVLTALAFAVLTDRRTTRRGARPTRTRLALPTTRPRVAGLLAGLAASAAAGFLIAGRSRPHDILGVSFGIWAGMAVVAATVVLPALNRQVDVTAPASVRAVFRADGVTAVAGLVVTTMAVAAVAVAAATLVSAVLAGGLDGFTIRRLPTSDDIAVQAAELVRAAVAAVGAEFGLWWLLTSAAGRFWLAWMWLAARRNIPVRFLSFLADAHARGVLRQVGTTYEFRHADVQIHLAESA